MIFSLTRTSVPGGGMFLHAVDAVALVHALILVQALVLPLQTLVFSGH